MKDKLRNFMVGRYGVDQFSKFLLALALIAMIVSSFIGGHILYTISIMILFYSYFRIFSKNIHGRYQENMIFLKYQNKFINIFRRGKNTIKQRKVYHIYKCPSCKQKIRIPRGKGRISITCPKCRREFIKKS
ncbi:MAG: hypothetical protein GX306_00620 [Clostridiales bacterium]|jgi:DNA-directed RNA polymerase subunit RPC12/RpoP|nr:hypothetical protein [Clostridiales bacterium]